MKCFLILSWLIYHGVPQAPATGATINFYHESHCDSNTINKNQNQIGIAQWQGSRKQKLIDYANLKQKPWSDLDLQLDFVLFQELDQFSFGKKFLALKSKSQAIYFFCKFYERPRGNCGLRSESKKMWK